MDAWAEVTTSRLSSRTIRLSPARISITAATAACNTLPSHPDHEIARRQMSGFGGMLCIDLAGSYERAEKTFDRLKVIKRAASLGGVESLCSLPVITSQYGHTDQQLAEAGVTKGMMRFSIGLEDPQDLIADLDQALA